MLPALLRCMTEKAVLVLAMVASTVEMALLAAAPYLSAVAAYGGIAVGALGTMSFPIISALKSVNAHEGEQGRVQGALFGAKALAQGLGPLIFSALFSYYAQPAHYFPSAPLIGLTLLMAVGAAVAIGIQPPPAGEGASARRAHSGYASEAGSPSDDKDHEGAPLVPREHSSMQQRSLSARPGSLDARHAGTVSDWGKGVGEGRDRTAQYQGPASRASLQLDHTSAAVEHARAAQHAVSHSIGSVNHRKLSLELTSPQQ